MRTITGQQPITVDELKSFLHFDGDDDDDQLTRCIAAGVDYIESETERDILVGSVVQEFDCWLPKMVLNNSPATAVTAIANDDEAFEGDYRFVQKEKARSFVEVSGTLLTGRPTVTYSTGMAAPKPMVTQACLWAAAHFYVNREPEVIGTITSKFANGLLRLISNIKAGGYA